MNNNLNNNQMGQNNPSDISNEIENPYNKQRHINKEEELNAVKELIGMAYSQGKMIDSTYGNIDGCINTSDILREQLSEKLLLKAKQLDEEQKIINYKKQISSNNNFNKNNISEFNIKHNNIQNNSQNINIQPSIQNTEQQFTFQDNNQLEFDFKKYTLDDIMDYLIKINKNIDELKDIILIKSNFNNKNKKK